MNGGYISKNWDWNKNKGDDMFKGDDDYAFRFVLVSRVAMGDAVNVK